MVAWYGYDNPRKKEILLKYRSTVREIEWLEREIQKWRSNAERMTASYHAAPASGGSNRRSIEEAVEQIDKLIRRFMDATDPFVYNECHYDKTRRRLYIFRELHQVRLKNRKAAELIKPLAGSRRITCDSAEPKSIDEMRDFGLNVAGAKKGPDSVEYGIKWLQDLEEIIIDPVRCPETAREFSGYELDRDKDGNFKAGFPDHDNHHIDAIRYACEDDMKRPSISILR